MRLVEDYRYQKSRQCNEKKKLNAVLNIFAKIQDLTVTVDQCLMERLWDLEMLPGGDNTELEQSTHQ